jgi:hypothetical protein
VKKIIAGILIVSALALAFSFGIGLDESPKTQEVAYGIGLDE